MADQRVGSTGDEAGARQRVWRDAQIAGPHGQHRPHAEGDAGQLDSKQKRVGGEQRAGDGEQAEGGELDDDQEP